MGSPETREPFHEVMLLFLLAGVKGCCQSGLTSSISRSKLPVTAALCASSLLVVLCSCTLIFFFRNTRASTCLAIRAAALALGRELLLMLASGSRSETQLLRPAPLGTGASGAKSLRGFVTRSRRRCAPQLLGMGGTAAAGASEAAAAACTLSRRQ
jgi:hypothetical protein